MKDKFYKMDEDIFKAGVLCYPRSSGRTYRQFLEIYKYAKLDGYDEIKIQFIDPHLDKLESRINKAIDILKLCNSKCSKEVIEILKGESKYD